MHFSIATERLFLFLLISVTVFHVVSCLLLFAAFFTHEQYPETKTWIKMTEPDWEEMTSSRLYLLGIYSTTSIGYGNIMAYNDWERVQALIIMTLGGFLMTFSISVLGQII